VPRRGFRFVLPVAINDDAPSDARTESEISGEVGRVSPELKSAASLSAKLLIAVLPFDNLSGDRGQEYFSDGISEDIITALSRVRWFGVVSRNSTFAYKGHALIWV